MCSEYIYLQTILYNIIIIITSIEISSLYGYIKIHIYKTQYISMY